MCAGQLNMSLNWFPSSEGKGPSAIPKWLSAIRHSLFWPLYHFKTKKIMVDLLLLCHFLLLTPETIIPKALLISIPSWIFSMTLSLHNYLDREFQNVLCSGWSHCLSSLSWTSQLGKTFPYIYPAELHKNFVHFNEIILHYFELDLYLSLLNPSSNEWPAVRGINLVNLCHIP